MYNSKFCDVNYKEELNIVFVKWKKFCRQNDYRTPLLYALDIMRSHDDCHYVADTRDGFEDDPADTQWLFDVFLPQTALTSCKFIFFIIDKDNSLKEELEGQATELGKFFSVRYCFDMDEVKSILDVYRSTGKNKNIKIKWSPRLKKEKLSRLYKLNAMQIIDHDLLQDVAITLYLRCKDIIAVYDAHYNFKVRCPGCYIKGIENYLDFPRGLKKRTRDSYIFNCADCGNSFSWNDFRSSHSRRQMNIGGAGDAFRRFISQFELNLNDNALMLEVDRLIHEFHYSLRADGITRSPGRIAAANLIDSDSITETVEFLDALSNGIINADMEKNAQIWRERVEKYHNFD